MTIDQRLEFLLQSTESLHSSLQEMSHQMQAWSERQKALEERSGRLHHALLSGIRTFLEGLNGDSNGNE